MMAAPRKKNVRIPIRQDGFTYLALIILITILSLTATATIQVGAIAQRRVMEEELLQIGMEFHNALISYAAVTPQGQSPYPSSMDDLLHDRRFPFVRRHLRKQYTDPLTGNNEWGVVFGSTSTGSGIMGLYSLSEAVPIKIGNFDAPFQNFRGKKSYQDWIFMGQLAPEVSAEPPVPIEPPPPPPPPRPKPGVRH